MKIIRLVLALLTLVTLTTACGREEPGAIGAKALEGTNTPALDAVHVNNDQRAEANRKAYEEGVKNFNLAFAEGSNWESTLTGADGSTICQLRDRFNDMESAMQYMNGLYTIGLAWKDVSVDKTTAEKKFRDAASQYATELKIILDRAFTRRLEMGTCGSGEASMELVDANYLMKDFIRALKSFGGSPDDIGISSEKLRQRLLEDYVARIQMARTEKPVEGHLYDLETLIREGTTNWNFTADQLKISRSEVDAANR